LNHDAIGELLAPFALDAVDPFEAAAVRAHLVDCPRCRDEVNHHQQAAAMLANTGGDAPAEVWDAIANRLDQPVPAKRDFPWPKATPRVGHSRSRRRPHRVSMRAGGLLVTAAVTCCVLGAALGRLDHQISHPGVASAAPSLSAAARDALLDPTSARVVLKSTGVAPQPMAEVVALRSGAAYLFNDGLPDLPAAETYQLWAMIDGQPISVGLLGRHPGTASFTLDPTDLTDAFAVTVEPAGGSVAPTRQPMASTTV
jgi:anti-sigma-K factor RskA